MSTELCSPTDVTNRPQLKGVSLTQLQTNAIPGWIEEASLLVQAYLEHTYDTTSEPPEPIPAQARVVTARMVARALIAPSRAADLDTYNSSMGPMGHSAHVAPDAVGGGVWLTRADKLILDLIAYRPGMSNVAMYDVEPCRPQGSIGDRLWPR